MQPVGQGGERAGAQPDCEEEQGSEPAASRGQPSPSSSHQYRSAAGIRASPRLPRERKLGEHGGAAAAAQASRLGPADRVAPACAHARRLPHLRGRPGREQERPPRPPPAAPLLGVNGNVARFRSQTGQASSVNHAFLHWEQGLSWGSPFAALFPALGPIPMIHLGTEGQNSPEAITPGGIAAGQGDNYLLALNRAIAVWNKGIYVRPLGEMNNSKNPWSGYGANGRPKDAAHSPATYRKAFARIYVILHGGTASAVNAKLRQLGLPPVQGELFTQPLPEAPDRLEPARGRRPSRRGQRGGALLPGARPSSTSKGDRSTTSASPTRRRGRVSRSCTALRARTTIRSRCRSGGSPRWTIRPSSSTCAPS